MTEEDIYKNILVIVLGLIGIAFIWDLSYLAIFSYSLGVLAIFIPLVARGVNWFWMKLAIILGWINSRILLTIIFFVILFPIALLRRIFGNSVLQLKRKSSSLYTERNHTFNKENLSDPW